jgi:hypothetical protein
MSAVCWLQDRHAGAVSERRPTAGPWVSLSHSSRLGGLHMGVVR